MTRDGGLPEGLYESLVTEQLLRDIAESAPVEAELADVDAALAPQVLARHVAAAVRRRLDRTRDPRERASVVNRLLSELDADPDSVVPPPRQLLSLVTPPAPGGDGGGRVRPATPLGDAALLTNATGEPALANELRAELDSADQIDLLCAFVKWHGVRLIEAQLTAARDRGVRFRVITTTYLGATERAALDRLVTELGADVRIQYDALRTRLHAKAWLFRRASGFDTAYVGSSNLSRAALLDGVEWNVRLSAVATPDLMAKFAATFDTY